MTLYRIITPIEAPITCIVTAGFLYLAHYSYTHEGYNIAQIEAVNEVVYGGDWLSELQEAKYGKAKH